MDQALRLEVWVFFINRSEELLNSHILALLLPGLHLSPECLEVDIEDLVGDGQLPNAIFYDFARTASALALADMGVWSVHVQSTVMSIWQCCFLDESEYLVEAIRHNCVPLVVQVEMQVIDIRV